MIDCWFESFKKDVIGFIKNSTDKELDDALKKSDFNYYNKINCNVFTEKVKVPS